MFAKSESDNTLAQKPGLVDRRTLTDADYQAFCEYLKKLCGIGLGENKQYLVTSRLAPLLDDYALESFSELIALIVNDNCSDIAAKVVDAMTTNETSWFRDRFPFELVKQHILPEIVSSGRCRINVWSAACSSGQEPYSISMAIEEFLDANPTCFLNSKIIATDISPAMINQARQGIYDNTALLRGLSAAQRDRFFVPFENKFQVNAEIRSRVSFRLLDLHQDYNILGKQDIIFCRNVLIYFSSELRDKIIERMIALMNPNSYLYLGASESLGCFARYFKTVRGDGGVVHQLK